MCPPITCSCKVFSIQIFQYLHQIPPRVCTLVLFIKILIIKKSSKSHVTGGKFRIMAGRTKSKVVLLPNTYERWPEVGSVLTNIRDGEVCSLEDFERLYPRLEFERPHRVSQIPTFSSLRRVLRNGKHFTTAHFLSTLLPWIAAKALQVQELFKDKGHRLPVRVFVCCIWTCNLDRKWLITGWWCERS